MKQAELSVSSGSAAMLKTTASLAAGMAAAFGVVAFVAIKEFVKFDKAMTESLAIMGDLSEGTKKSMAELARSMSGETIQSAEELAKAYFFLASAGLDAEQSMKALPAVAKFATAGMFDLSTATTLLADAQSALGLRSKDATENLKNMTRVSDVLSKANVLANADIRQFSEALTNKAAAALRSVNKDVEEGVAVLATFADQGLKGAAAGEALAIVLRDLQRASIENRDMFNQMGVSVFDAQGNINNLADVMGSLEKAMAGATVEERRMAFAMMGFQDRSLSAILALMGTSQRIREYEAALRQAGGTTEEISSKNLASLSSQLTITKNLFEDLLITIGEGLAPTLVKLNDELKEMAKSGTAANESIKETASVLGTALVYAAKAVLFVFGGIRDLLKVLLMGFLKLMEQTLTFQIILLDLVKLISNQVIRVVVDGFNFMIQSVNQVIDLLPAAIRDRLGLAPMKKIANDFTVPFVDTVREKLQGMLETVKGTNDELWQGLVKTSVGAAEAIKPPTTAIVNTLKGIGTAAEQATTKVGNALSQVKKMIDSAKVNELLKALGLPEGGLRGPTPTAAELMKAIQPGQGGQMEAGKAIEMLQRAGLQQGGGGTATQLFDPFSQQAQAVSNEIQMNQDKLKILEDLGNQEVELTEEVQKRKAAAIEAYNEQVKKLQMAQNMILIQAGQEMFGALTAATKAAAGEQSAIYKVMFAASKAFAIAESIIKIQQGVAGALALPFPANLVAVAAVVAAAANIVSTIQSVQLEFGGEKAEGGPVSPGKAFLVGERGPEMFSPSRSGSIISNDQLDGGGTKVIINNYTDVQPQVTERQEGDQKVVEIVLRRLRSEISSEVRDGRGDIPRSMEQTWGLKRGKQ